MFACEREGDSPLGVCKIADKADIGTGMLLNVLAGVMCSVVVHPHIKLPTETEPMLQDQLTASAAVPNSSH